MGQQAAPGFTAADVTAVGAAIGARLRQLGAALSRHDAFVFGDAPAASPAAAAEPADGGPAAATALVLRALRCASEATGWRIMRQLAARDLTTRELAAALGCPRLIAWELVNDLVQAGLAARAMEGDGVTLTAAGHGLVRLVETLAGAVAASGPDDGGGR